MSSLFEKLGGKPKISEIVDKMFENLLKDDAMAPYFANSDVKEQAEKTKQFFTMMTGGSVGYEAYNLKNAH